MSGSAVEISARLRRGSCRGGGRLEQRVGSFGGCRDLGRLWKGRLGKRIGVSDFGIRFVWYGELFELQQVLECAVKPLMHHGFVAIQERGIWVGREAPPGSGEVGERALARLVRKGFVHTLLLDGPGAAHAPIGGDHLFEKAELGGGARAELLGVLVEEELELLVGFVLQDYLPGEESVAEGVLGRARFALGGLGAAGLFAVGAGGFAGVVSKTYVFLSGRSIDDEARRQRGGAAPEL